MPSKKSDTTLIAVYIKTNEKIKAIKRRLAASENKSFDNPKTLDRIIDSYIEAHPKGKR